jgi:hypothetical protein
MGVVTAVKRPPLPCSRPVCPITWAFTPGATAGVGGNGNGHGKRKGNNGDGQASYGVAAKAIKGVTFTQGRHEFWGKFIFRSFYRVQGF